MTKCLKPRLGSRSLGKQWEKSYLLVHPWADRERRAQHCPLPGYLQTGHPDRDSVETTVSRKPMCGPWAGRICSTTFPGTHTCVPCMGTPAERGRSHQHQGQSHQQSRDVATPAARGRGTPAARGRGHTSSAGMVAHLFRSLCSHTLFRTHGKPVSIQL